MDQQLRSTKGQRNEIIKNDNNKEDKWRTLDMTPMSVTHFGSCGCCCCYRRCLLACELIAGERPSQNRAGENILNEQQQQQQQQQQENNKSNKKIK